MMDSWQKAQAITYQALAAMWHSEACTLRQLASAPGLGPMERAHRMGEWRWAARRSSDRAHTARWYMGMEEGK